MRNTFDNGHAQRAAAEILSPDEHRAAVAGRVFAKTCGIDTAADETRFRMRRARVGSRIVDVYRHGVHAAALTELPDAAGWAVEYHDGRNWPPAVPPTYATFTAALAAVDAPYTMVADMAIDYHSAADAARRAWGRLYDADGHLDLAAVPAAVEALGDLAARAAGLRLALAVATRGLPTPEGNQP